MAVFRRCSRSAERGMPSERVSPLVILQARFQQKQLQEKEEKLLKLYEEQQKRALKSVGSRSGGSSVSCASSVGAGKVRSLFESRRRISEAKHAVAITGRDKSYPLEPLPNYNSNSDAYSPDRPQRSLSLDRRNFFPNSKVERTVRKEVASNQRHRDDPLDFRRNFREARNGKEGRVEEGRDSLLTDHQDITGRFHEPRVAADHNRNWIFRSKPSHALDLPSSHGDKMDGKFRSHASQGILTEKPQSGNRTFEGRSEISNGSVNSPVRKIRKPTPVPPSVTPTNLGLQKETKKPSRPEPIRENSVPVSPARRNQPSSGSYSKPPTSAGRISTPARSSPGQFSPPTLAGKSSSPSDLVDCKICGRHFTAERVSKHEEVCQKSTRYRRKPFDALQQRVRGTEVEKYVKKSSSKMTKSQTEKPTKPQTDWRKKHEEFIQNIRAAKEVSIHLKKGGKLSDLPPPPPSDYSDYIQCPHCSRKFNSAAAERHIPKCANIINKPKPAMQRNAAIKQGSKLGASPSARGRK